ncbi:MAG: hypothetical protein SGCHY_003923 [Lobulomycetales sp.]
MSLGEHRRAAHAVSGIRTNLAIFLHLYNLYLAAGETQSELLSVDEALQTAITDLSPERDAWLLFLQALVKSRLSATPSCIVDLLIESVNLAPLNWSAWQLLAQIPDAADSLALSSIILRIPNSCPTRPFFIVLAGADRSAPPPELDDALDQLLELYPNSNTVKALAALLHYHNRDFSESENIFKEIYASDPECLDHMDVYSNVLFCLGREKELAMLAETCFAKDPHRVESCIVSANYYSTINDQEKAICHLEHAIKIDPTYHNAWTLIGHEFVELKDTNSAIKAYRKAVSLSPRDYRAWYGLGQAYQVLGMPLYSLQYYKKAALLRPSDSRMWTALASAYTAVDEFRAAERCLRRALVAMQSEHGGDSAAIEVLARIADLLLRLGDRDAAAWYYKLVVAERVPAYRVYQTAACKFLKEYYIAHGDSREAAYYARELEFL